MLRKIFLMLLILAVLFFILSCCPHASAQPATPHAPPAKITVLPPVHVIQKPPYYQHQIPYRPAIQIDLSKIPSNQDIKDGVERPIDTLYGYTSFGHDYYAEFRARYGFSPEDREKRRR